MIGSEIEAEAALAGTLELLGEGCSRYVYINPSKTVVYKVEHYENGAHSCNESEFSRAGIVLPPPIVIPDMFLFPNGVLAMEYVEGTMAGECNCAWTGEEHDETCLPDELVDEVTKISSDAATWGNSVWQNGSLFLIDLGH